MSEEYCNLGQKGCFELAKATWDLTELDVSKFTTILRQQLDSKERVQFSSQILESSFVLKKIQNNVKHIICYFITF